MRKVSLLAAVLLVVAGAAFSQSLVVSYADGTVELLLKGQKTWTVLDIGAQVPRDAQVRVSDNGTLEMLAGKTRISIIKNGTYLVADLIKTVGGSSSTGLGASVAQKLHGLTTEREKQGTAGGVRGAAVGSSELVWVDESTEIATEVRDLFAKGMYPDAVPILTEAIEAAYTPEEKDEFSFLLASAYSGNGETARAWHTLSPVKLDPATTYYQDMLVLKGQLQADAQQYGDALATLKPLLDPLAKNEYGQTACLVAYYCYKGLDQPGPAADVLKRGVAIDPSTETAKQLAALQGK